MYVSHKLHNIRQTTVDKCASYLSHFCESLSILERFTYSLKIGTSTPRINSIWQNSRSARQVRVPQLIARQKRNIILQNFDWKHRAHGYALKTVLKATLIITQPYISTRCLHTYSRCSVHQVQFVVPSCSRHVLFSAGPRTNGSNGLQLAWQTSTSHFHPYYVLGINNACDRSMSLWWLMARVFWVSETWAVKAWVSRYVTLSFVLLHYITDH